MHVLSLRVSALAAAVLGAMPVALADPPSSPAAGHAIDVSVNYSFILAIGNEQGEALKALHEGGRRSAYEIAGRECALLLQTIATSCSLERINVNSNQQRNGIQDQIIVNANASFRIDPKSK